MSRRERGRGAQVHVQLQQVPAGHLGGFLGFWITETPAVHVGTQVFLQDLGLSFLLGKYLGVRLLGQTVKCVFNLQERCKCHF